MATMKQGLSPVFEGVFRGKKAQSPHISRRTRKKVELIVFRLRHTKVFVTGVPVVFVSALEGKGRGALMHNVNESHRRWRARLCTARLNRWLAKVMSRHPRRGDKGYGAKVRYITQVKARPPTFVVFVSGAGKIDDTELRFFASSLHMCNRKLTQDLALVIWMQHHV
ncbi:unnamed protein product [Sphagnum troendelagicum]